MKIEIENMILRNTDNASVSLKPDIHPDMEETSARMDIKSITEIIRNGYLAKATQE